jgi:hypothetical protein
VKCSFLYDPSQTAREMNGIAETVDSCSYSQVKTGFFFSDNGDVRYCCVIKRFSFLV